MHILILSTGFILWYLAYEAKPIINEEGLNHWEEETILKRNRLLSILNKRL